MDREWAWQTSSAMPILKILVHCIIDGGIGLVKFSWQQLSQVGIMVSWTLERTLVLNVVSKSTLHHTRPVG